MLGDDLLSRAEAELGARKLSAALALFDKAERHGIDVDRCCAGRWTAQMLLGEFEAAWQEGDAIRRRGVPDPHRFWQGEALEGRRIILRCLHGLGDSVQFFRYVPRLRRMASRLSIEVPPNLVNLAQCFKGVGHVVSWGDRASLQPVRWDVQIEVNELPYIFRTRGADLPMETGYLHLPAWLLQRNRIESREPGCVRVGLVWSSGEWNKARSVPFDLMGPLLLTPGCEFWNLQGGAARDEWHRLPAAAHLHSAASCAQNVVNLAAIIAQLDLVITPDTLAAHLAGAMGVAACVMLPFAADWRWQHARNDSPWYPSLRLFRQPKENAWGHVVHSVHVSLQQHIQSLRPSGLVA